MRAKVVILTLLIAIAVVATMALLRGARRQAAVAPPPTEVTTGVPEEQQTNPPERSSTNLTVQSPVQDARTVLEKITDIQAEGSPTPEGRAVLLAVLKESQDKEARKAALNAIVQLDDTGAIAGLEQALPQLTDPRDKAAVLDAIDQLKLPSTTPEVAVSSNIRSQIPPGKKVKINPRFQGKNARGGNPALGSIRGPSQPVATPDVPQPQPAAPQ